MRRRVTCARASSPITGTALPGWRPPVFEEGGFTCAVASEERQTGAFFDIKSDVSKRGIIAKYFQTFWISRAVTTGKPLLCGSMVFCSEAEPLRASGGGLVAAIEKEQAKAENTQSNS